MQTGYVFKDGRPIPDDELEKSSRAGNIAALPANPSNRSGLSTTEAPTMSHALAEADHDEKGSAQIEHFEGEVKDLGWNEPGNIVQPLVGGLQNADLWLLLRRFNKQVSHVKATAMVPLGGLDLSTADSVQEEISPDKLQVLLERLYMTVVIGLVGFVKHIVRLRSWREPRRTSAFAAAYFLAWMLNLVVPLLVATSIALIVYPPARSFLFPPAPLALVNFKTGGIQSPQAGTLGSHDSVTGAPENYRGEAVEQEANNIVSRIVSIAMRKATEKKEPAAITEAILSPEPSKVAAIQADVKAAIRGANPNEGHDKTKQPMEEIMWSMIPQLKPVIHVVEGVVDGWERFENALSPTSPFPKNTPRVKLASLLVPVLAVSLVASSAMFMKMMTFFVGFGFFSDPLLWPTLDWLNRTFPNWQQLLELRNNILRGVPTNAQLTITLLRIGEANKAPLPPPPRSDGAPSDKPASLDKDQLTLDATDHEIDAAIHPDPYQPSDPPPGRKHRAGAKVIGFIKTVTKTAVDAKFGTDKVRAAVGSERAKNHLGILPQPDEAVISGPVEFRARYQGKKGWVYINTSATIPCVAFSSHTGDGTGEHTASELKPIFSIPINDIQELKKIGGLNVLAKLVVDWATDGGVADGLEIVARNGETWKLTAVPLREELFNRLIAMGGQKWESL